MVATIYLNLRSKEAHMEDYFREMLQKIKYEVIPGLSLEIRDCLKCNDNVHKFNLVINQDKIYSIDIKLKVRLG